MFSAYRLLKTKVKYFLRKIELLAYLLTKISLLAQKYIRTTSKNTASSSKEIKDLHKMHLCQFS